MTLRFVTFGSLPAGAYFRARDRQWVKGPGDCVSDGVRFNAYAVIAPNQEKTRVALFAEEALVRNDPDLKLALWACPAQINT